MRVLFPLVLLVLLVGLAGFMLNNSRETASVTIWGTRYAEVSLHRVVIIAVAVGVVFTALVALVEGASVRLANRRLRRELHKLETEVNYLRTQPATRLPEPDALVGEPSPIRSTPRAAGDEGHTPSAPVYGATEGEEPLDPDEDVYSGGRAV